MENKKIIGSKGLSYSSLNVNENEWISIFDVLFPGGIVKESFDTLFWLGYEIHLKCSCGNKAEMYKMSTMESRCMDCLNK